MDYHAMTMTGRDYPENVNVIGLLANAFDDLGVPPVLGRGIGRADAIDGRDPQPVALLSYKFWQSRFFSDPNVVGKTLQLDRQTYTIIGVAAPRFTWYIADVYLPLVLTQDPDKRCIVDFRLKPGVTHQAIDAALNPAQTDYLYYVRDPARDDGAHNFYNNSADFERGVRALREWEAKQGR